MRGLTKFFWVTTIFLLVSTTVFGVSKEPYCFAGSDYFSISSYAPQIIALYDDTTLFFDVNYDGVWDYKKSIRDNEAFVASLPWSLRAGSYIHADKPVVVNQRTYDVYNSYNGNQYTNYYCVPPITSLKNDLVLITPAGSGSIWKIISPNSYINILDRKGELIEENVTDTTTINTLSDSGGVWYVNSTNPVIASSKFGLSSQAGKDFIKVMGGKTRLGVVFDETTVRFDINNDGVFDEENTLGKGVHDFTLLVGSRITSNKKIGVFEYQDPGSITDFSPALPTNSINNELFVTIHNPNTYISGLFGDNLTSLENTTYVLVDEAQNIQLHQEVSPNTANIIPKEFSNTLRVLGDKPISAYNTKNSKGLIFQRPYQTIEPYMTSFSKKKSIALNDSVLINVRVLNPSSYDIRSVKVDVLFLSTLLGGEEIEYFLSVKKLLDEEVVISTQRKSVVPIILNSNIKSFSVSFDVIRSGEYVDIDYYLISPDYQGRFVLPSSALSFTSEVWSIEEK
ncbi:hypothetical protein GOV05_00985 [Candidatus Woesearchaeota archaeon]|nr:hypothetical protein [Candidatus Woesearchaeota archaeon]